MLKYYIHLYGSWQRTLSLFVLAGMVVPILYILLVGFMILGGAQ